jgi:tripartite-type tricarboxylate transporter receptor subunit TctC
MKLPRRQFLQLAAGAAVLPVCASAQAYPSRPVKIIVGQAAGSASDKLVTPKSKSPEYRHVSRR